jgi:hypothetical protein
MAGEKIMGRLVAWGVVSVALAFCLSAGGVQTAAAQPAERGEREVRPDRGGDRASRMRGAAAPRVSGRDATLIADMIGLDETGAEVLASLHEEYLASHMDAVETFRAYMEEAREVLRERRSRELFEQFRDARERFEARLSELEEAFYADAKLLVNPGDEVLWERVERMRLRQSELGSSSLTGASVDVLDAFAAYAERARSLAEAAVEEDGAMAERAREFASRVPELGEEARASAMDVLERYETDLHRLLVERRRMTEEAGSLREMAEEERLPFLEERRELAVRIRDLSRRYAEQAAAALPEDAGAALLEEVNRRTAPRLYRETVVGRALAQLGSEVELSIEQSAAVAELREEFSAQLSRLNERVLNAQFRWDAERPVESFFSRRGVEEPRELTGAQEARASYLAEVRRRLESLLTPEQLELVPGLGEEAPAELPELEF